MKLLGTFFKNLLFEISITECDNNSFKFKSTLPKHGIFEVEIQFSPNTIIDTTLYNSTNVFSFDSFTNIENCLSMINELRTIRGAAPLGTVTEQDILDERARELYTEGWRRNDLIRFGQYTKDWDFKAEDAVGDPNRQLFPIPSAQLILNPNLVQNPGY